MFLKAAVVSFAIALPTVLAWGENGHMTIGFTAMQFLAPKALSFVQTTLGEEAANNKSLGPAATWADTVRSQSAFSWSAPFHFVDAEDNPPTSCSVVQTRDCSAGTCILDAIANYTARVVETSLPAEQILEALKFLDHFIGDITQPLHVEALELGGNDISVKCSGSSTNLHATWDTGMITKLLATNYSNSLTTWSNTLATRIKTGAYQSLAPTWISCSSPTLALNSRSSLTMEDDISNFLSKRATAAVAPLECPIEWARDSNAFDCSFVFNFTASQDLCTSSYYTNAVPIIELQIAKAAYRLAAWLNVLFDGATNLPA